MLRGAPALLLAGLLLAPRGAAGVREDPPQEAFDDTITVALDTIVVRVVDGSGQPVLGLTPKDFRVLVHGKEIPVVAVDWVSSGTVDEPWAEPLLRLPAEEGAAPVPQAREPGKLVVFFVQADLNPTRISGQMRIRPYTRELLASLSPSDRVAVVSYDSHLKLWLDFTDDREAVHDAVDRAMIYSPEASVAPSGPPSLASRFDFAEARRVASPERALEMTARALAGLPGEKTMIYLGWGLGRFGSFGTTMTPDYEPAVKALSKARVSVFVLDVTSADYHSLEVGLQSVAEATGGAYESTFRLPSVATHRIARAISGWYVLTFDRDASGGIEPGRVTVKLRGRRGEVLARPVAVR
ncbi:MAG TPA: VWA domain-containing protein [Thermoanaerobaculia bacterium]|nr:VWA domain-containing protein [Thermoanaerobaculia bacterium]